MKFGNAIQGWFAVSIYELELLHVRSPQHYVKNSCIQSSSARFAVGMALEVEAPKDPTPEPPAPTPAAPGEVVVGCQARHVMWFSWVLLFYCLIMRLKNSLDNQAPPARPDLKCTALHFSWSKSWFFYHALRGARFHTSWHDLNQMFQNTFHQFCL